MTTEIRYPIRKDVSECFDRYRDAMRPFIMSALNAIPGRTPEQHISGVLKEHQAENFQQAVDSRSSVEDAFDETLFPRIVEGHWHNGVSGRIRESEDRHNFRSWLWELRTYRNEDIGHRPSRDLGPERAIQYIDVISDVLKAIGAESDNADVLAFRNKIINSVDPRIQHQQNGEAKLQTSPTSGSPAPPKTQYKPWREVIKPNDDVIDGNLRQADFAADLQKVYDGEAEDNMYGNPLLFFRQTYMTKGINDLLTSTLKRLAGTGGYPVIQAKTGFGGGKTHSLIALYHLVTSGSTIANANWDERDRESRDCVRDIMTNAGVSIDEGINAKVSVLNGNYLSPTDTHTTEDGEPLNTLWGVMAYQLGGQAAYNVIGEAAREGSAPGGRQLRQLFDAVGPCVILMDEIVNYVRNVNDYRRIESIYSFFQSLTEAVNQANQVVVVISLPESEVELGSTEGAVEILRHLETILGRVETVWRPVEDQEGFEVVRRQLFRDETCDVDARNATCEYYFNAYTRKNLRSKFPNEASQPEYLERMKQCYPIHPEVFDRLYNDWSTLHQFQRTRGVLRLLAICVNLLYTSEDADMLIAPGSLPIREAELSNEFLRLLTPNWNPVLDEVDKEGSRIDEIDRGSSNFREHNIAKRMARSIFLGSPPHQYSPGLRDQNATLGAYIPGTAIGHYGNALKIMGERLYHLYREQGRHRFNSDVNLTRVINDRRSQLAPEDREDELVRRIRNWCDHHIAIACPDDSSEVPDSEQLQIVILKPSETYHQNPATNKANLAASDIVTAFGDQPRLHRNTLLFLAPTTDHRQQLDESIRSLLAWQSILDGEQRFAQLSEPRLQEAHDGSKNAEADLEQVLKRSYNRVGVPVADGTGRYLCKWQNMARRDLALVDRIDAVVTDPNYVTQLTPDDILSVLGRYQTAVEPNRNVTVTDVWHAMTTDTEAPRPRDWEAVEQAIRAGLTRAVFGYAATYNQEQDKYQSLSIGGKTLEDGCITVGEPETIVPAGIMVECDVANMHLSKADDLTVDYSVPTLEVPEIEMESETATIDNQSEPTGVDRATEGDGIGVAAEYTEINQGNVETITMQSDVPQQILESGAEISATPSVDAHSADSAGLLIPDQQEVSLMTEESVHDPSSGSEDQGGGHPTRIAIDFRPGNEDEHMMSNAFANQWATALANEGNQVQKRINFVYRMSADLQEIPYHWEMQELVKQLINQASPVDAAGGSRLPDVSFTVTATNPSGVRSRIVDGIRNVAAIHEFISISAT